MTTFQTTLRQVNIQRNGRLAVNGGNAHGSRNLLGGGAGGIIQIITPEGSLAAETSFLGHGDFKGCTNFDRLSARGYMYLPGNVQCRLITYCLVALWYEKASTRTAPSAEKL